MPQRMPAASKIDATQIRGRRLAVGAGDADHLHPLARMSGRTSAARSASASRGSVTRDHGTVTPGGAGSPRRPRRRRRARRPARERGPVGVLAVKRDEHVRPASTCRESYAMPVTAIGTSGATAAGRRLPAGRGRGARRGARPRSWLLRRGGLSDGRALQRQPAHAAFVDRRAGRRVLRRRRSRRRACAR